MPRGRGCDDSRAARATNEGRMTRREWMEIALALGDVYRRLLKRKRMAQARGAYIAALTTCRAIRLRSSRFDSRRFMRAVRSATI